MHKRTQLSVALEVLPVGIAVCVGSGRRRIKRLVGWETIETAPINIIVLNIDELSEHIEQT